MSCRWSKTQTYSIKTPELQRTSAATFQSSRPLQWRNIVNVFDCRGRPTRGCLAGVHCSPWAHFPCCSKDVREGFTVVCSRKVGAAFSNHAKNRTYSAEAGTNPYQLDGSTIQRNILRNAFQFILKIEVQRSRSP